MKPTARSRRIFVLLLSLLGTAALFLPFTSGVSPWEAVYKDFLGRFFLLGAPFFLSILILAWQARRLVVDRTSTAEIAVAYALSMVAMLSVLGFVTWLLTVKDSPGKPNEIISIALCIALAGANMLLLVRNRRARLSREATAETFLLGGYLPNAIFCLVMWYPQEIFSGWEIGAYMIAVVCVGYVVAIVLALRSVNAQPSPAPAHSG